MSIRTQQAAPTDPLSLFDGDPIKLGTGGAVRERERIGAAPTDNTTNPGDDSNGDDETDGGLALIGFVLTVVCRRSAENCSAVLSQPVTLVVPFDQVGGPIVPGEIREPVGYSRWAVLVRDR